MSTIEFVLGFGKDISLLLLLKSYLSESHILNLYNHNIYWVVAVNSFGNINICFFFSPKDFSSLVSIINAKSPLNLQVEAVELFLYVNDRL